VLFLSVNKSQKLDLKLQTKNYPMKEKDNLHLNTINESVKRLWHITNLDDGINEIIYTSAQITKTDLGTFQFYNSTKKSLKIVANKGLSNQFIIHFKHVYSGDDTVCGCAFSQRKQVVIGNVIINENFKEHHKIFNADNIKSVQSTPLFNRNGLPIAIVSTHSSSVDYFDEESLSRMQLYARFAEYFIERMKELEQTIKYNVSLEKKVKERTEQLTDALKNAYKLNKIKSKFLSIASHELKTPLSSILSSIYLIEQYNKNEHTENRNKHLKRIEGNIKNLLTVIDDFLSIEKIEIQKIGIKKKHFNLFELIENITDELKLISKYNQSIFFSSKRNGMIYSDEKIVSNLITNLLSNAIKYSEENIFINACKTGSTFKIEIKDSGIGIPSEDKKYIFNSYFRATNASGVKGTGLGLNIVKKYIEILGGTINFKSNENFGTTFYLKLPEN